MEGNSPLVRVCSQHLCDGQCDVVVMWAQDYGCNNFRLSATKYLFVSNDIRELGIGGEVYLLHGTLTFWKRNSKEATS